MLKDYRAVMHACLRAGAWDQALTLWHEFRAQADGPTPCARTYSIALLACSALGDWSTARGLLDEMRATGGDLAPGARHYGLAAGAAVVADDLALDRRAAFDGHGWGADAQQQEQQEVRSRDVTCDGEGKDADVQGGGEASRGTGRGTALESFLEEMSKEGVGVGCTTYVAISWARARQNNWHGASLGVLELMGRWGLGDTQLIAVPPLRSEAVATGRVARKSHRALYAEGIRGLYARMLSAAGNIPRFEGGEEGVESAVRRVLIDAENRLADAGGVGPQVLGVAARAFARARDWQGARDMALRLCSPEGSSVPGYPTREVEGGNASVDGRNSVEVTAAAFAAAIDAAVIACAYAGQADEAKVLAERAREAATAAAAATSTQFTASGSLGGGFHGSSSSSAAGKSDAVSDFGDGGVGSGLGRKACVALAQVFEEAGRLSDAEDVRLRLQNRWANNLGLDVVGAASDGAESTGPRVLPNIGGRVGGAGDRQSESYANGGVGPRIGDELLVREGSKDVNDEEGHAVHQHSVGGTHEYDMFLEWMTAGEELEEDELWDGVPLEDIMFEKPKVDVVAEEGAEWEELTMRELEGW